VPENPCVSLFMARIYRSFIEKIIITAGSRVLPEKLRDQQLVKKFHTFYGTAFTSARNLSLYDTMNLVYAFSSHFLEIQFNIILPSALISSKWSLAFRSLHKHSG